MLETLELEIQLCILTGESKRMKIAYIETTKLLVAVTDPRINGPIKESGGKMFMQEKNYKEAYVEFYASFCAYQETGNYNAKLLLKYSVLSSILAHIEINVLETREAKV